MRVRKYVNKKVFAEEWEKTVKKAKNSGRDLSKIISFKDYANVLRDK